MPIRVDYSPVGTLMNLARSTGEAQGARESATHDLAFTQMAMQAQTQNAQIASTIRRNDQAFQLQRAALARQTRTPTRAAPGISPVAQELDKVLGRATVARGWEQQDVAAQMGQLETLAASGQYTEAQIEGARLAVLGGQSPAQYLLQKKETERAGLTAPQRESRRRTLYSQQRSDLEAERERLLDERQYEGWEHSEAWQRHLDAVISRIQTLDVTYRKEAIVPERKETDIPQPMPATKAEAVVGEIYAASDGGFYRWTGTKMIWVGGTSPRSKVRGERKEPVAVPAVDLPRSLGSLTDPYFREG